ncbi:MOSC domain-containing protein [Nocardioides silvaticus]|uniref:MOSC domain-containing protein n=1 Tax=Nocardioides silvaticus TaxID=2201891 RepID=A0A316TPQ7_9ACTN|nr:MOSC domain-containing protein [Nocardioides silvaticus]PWN01696.1 MOSC domain-containing protein [Nocardioides silvaticus]
MPRLLSVNVGLPKEAEWAGIGRTSIDKARVSGVVKVTELGVEGDQVSDTQHHGGIDQAVYAYAREDLDFWEGELALPIRDGQFAENLTTEGIDLNSAAVGTRLRVGDVLLEIASVRTPCNDFKCWMGLNGFDNAAWVKRFAAALRPGPYLRVLETGSIAAGDPIEVVHEPDHGITVRDLFIALNLDRTRLPELLAIDDLAPRLRRRVEDYLAR